MAVRNLISVCVLCLVMLLFLNAGCIAEGKRSRTPELPLPAPVFQLDKKVPDPNRASRPNTSPYSGPIIDTHVHVLNKDEAVDFESVRQVMAKVKLERIIFLPVPNEGLLAQKDELAELRRSWRNSGGDKVGLLCGSDYLTTWMNNAYRTGYSTDDLEARLTRLRQDLDTGQYLGVGEIGPYHFDKRPHMKVICFPMSFEPFLKVAEIAAEKGVWLDLHAEPKEPDGKSHEDEVFGGIALLYQRFPNITLILSHTAMTNPTNARALLDKYPTLMFNMKIAITKGDFKWDHLGPITNRDFELYENWARLMEDKPERFMIGSDGRLGEQSRSILRYGKQIGLLRSILGVLRPDVADMIAHGNARRLMGQR